MTMYEKILHDTAHIVVMGLGYVGLPIATEFARSGFTVTGLDPDGAKIDALSRSESYLERPDSETLKFLWRFSATTDPAVLSTADVVIICVPTPLSKTKEPDLSLVCEAVEQVAKHQHKDMLIVLESTSYPGTTREFLVPLLTKNFAVGEDVFVGYSPERIDPGNPQFHLTNTPKLVSGITEKCAQLTHRLYLKISTEVVPVSSPEVAEMAKILENSFRAVNIGLANEIALISKKLNIDPFEVIDAAATKPFGYMPFYPGPGLGGHCIPVDPLYLSWKLRSVNSQARFIELADTINSGMPDHVVEVASEALNSISRSVRGSKILVLGVAYKPDVADLRESPVLPIMLKLLHLGATVSYEDPHIPLLTEPELLLQSLTNVDYSAFDLVVITTPHKSFDLDDVSKRARLIVDTRGALRDASNRTLKDPKIFRI
jgi:UDP-N-acetyl-D-glucosamine dehydrogenase